MFNGALRSPHTGVPGWETEAEQSALIEAARNTPQGGIIVEIGAEFGMSASLFCNFAHPTVDIFSIDLFPGDLLQAHLNNLQQAGLEGRSHQIRGDSGELGLYWKEGDIDLLFIDGDHTYEGVKRDIRAWTPHVAVGGLVIFHDCACATNLNPHELHYEVSRAIDDWNANDGTWLEGRSVDTMRFFRRNA